MTAFWIILATYLIGLTVFLIQIYREAPRHGVSPFQFNHVFVAIIWPFWAIWYGISLLRDKVSRS